MPQRAYPRLFTNNVMEIQKILNQMCDWIFAGSGGSTTASGGATTASQIFMPLPDLQLTNNFQPVPGTLMPLAAGKWQVVGLFFFDFDTTQSFCFGSIYINGAIDPHVAECGITGPPAAEKFTVERTWLVDLPSGGDVQLAAGHQNLGAAAFLIAGQSSILAIKVG